MVLSSEFAALMAAQTNKRSKKSRPITTTSDKSPATNEMDALTSNLAQTILTNTHPRLTRGNIVAEFNRYFGDISKLDNWQRLCHDVGIEDDLPSVKKCREALKKVWVNIFDLIDAVRNDSCPPKRFNSQGALARYTISKNKIFPRKKAKEAGPVRALLAHIF